MDQLLRELGTLGRQEAEADRARFDERWDRLAAGTLTAEEEAELKALADSSPEAREAYEAFRPLGAGFQAKVLSAIQTAEWVVPDPPPPPPPPFWRRTQVWLGTAAAMAAGVFVCFVWPLVVELLRQPAPVLSGYVAKLEGGFKTNRGGETASPNETRVYAPGSPFILEVSPKQPLDHPGKVKAKAFLSSSTGREDLRPLAGLENKFESGENGSVRLKNVTMGEDVKVKPGDWIFWTVVAFNSLPEAREVQTRLLDHQPLNASWKDICDAIQKEEKPSSAPSQVACVGFRVEGQPDP